VLVLVVFLKLIKFFNVDEWEFEFLLLRGRG